MKTIETHPSGYGQYKISTFYHGKMYSTHTNNMPAIDRYRDSEHPLRKERGQTRAQAAQSLYNEIKRANSLH